MWRVLQEARVRDVLDVAIVGFVLYRVLVAFRGTVVLQMVTGLGLILGARYVAHRADLRSLAFLLDGAWGYWALVLVVLFQPEVRRALTQAGRSRLLRGLTGQSLAERRQAVEEIGRAVESLAGKRIGALIALERSATLLSYAELGVTLEAVVSAELLGSVFQPGSPLHDGAAIVQGGRLTAAGCFLPLSRNLTLARTLGTRHRAAVGLSEETDAVVVIVSEESGAVSLAVDGALERGLDATRLEARLIDLLALRDGAPTHARRSWLAGVRRSAAREKA